jgi:hypothetical protein
MNEMGFDRSQLLELLDALSQRFQADHTPAHIFIVGGAAMTLAYSAERSTHDIDAVFVPKNTVLAAVRQIADDRGLPEDWLNDAVKGFLPSEDANPIPVYHTEYLQVEVASAKYLLAMKLYSGRQTRDRDDSIYLFNLLELNSSTEAMDILEAAYPSALLEARHHYVVQDVATQALSLRNEHQPESLIQDFPAAATIHENCSYTATPSDFNPGI